MIFNSLQYLVFFPVITALYFITPFRHRWLLLLAGSYYFYMSWNVKFVFLIIFSTAFDYFIALAMDKTDNEKLRKRLVMLSIFLNLTFLFIFKYLTFFTEQTQHLVHYFGLDIALPNFNILLPVGISFYTFQTLSYTIDVYKRKIKPERHFGIFALYVSFFPQLVAGPIERSDNLLPQFHKNKPFDYEMVTGGLKLMAWGFFKKLVIADRAAVIVNTVYNNPSGYDNGAYFIIATVAFAFQIYGDFSGYSDIAIGSARVLGFNLMRNFDRPYSAAGIAEFWRKWHISLSSWFKDYLYIPLGGSRVSFSRWAFNIFVVFLVSGLWHGASWTFILWGAVHGVLQILQRTLSPYFRKYFGFLYSGKFSGLGNMIFVISTFVFVNLAWVLFRANNISDALYIFRHIFVNVDFSSALSAFNSFDMKVLIGSVVLMEIVQYVGSRLSQNGVSFRDFHFAVRWPCYWALVLWIFVFAKTGSHDFIYFQF